jgi:nitroreductase
MRGTISGQRFKDEFEKMGVPDYDAYQALLKFRRSVRGFRNERVPRELIEKILEAARWAPSAGNSQPWEFIVVENRKIIQELARLYEYQLNEKKWLDETREKELRMYVGNQPVEGKAPFRAAHCMIFALADERWGNAFPVRTWLDKGSQHIISSMANAVFAMHCAAATLGLATQWISDFGSPWLAGMTKHVLGIPRLYKIYDAMPIGYPKYYPKPRHVKPLDQIIHYDHYDISKLKTEEDICKYIALHIRPGLKFSI